jgi:hypothetical protein
MDIHVQSYKTDLYKNSVINKGTKLYYKTPGYIKEMDSYKAIKRVEIISFISHFLLSGGICLIIYDV